MANTDTYQVAIALDGEILDVLHMNGKLAAILLSEPKIIDVTPLYEGTEHPFNVVGWEVTDDGLVVDPR